MHKEDDSQLTFQLADDRPRSALIKVIGVGGGGGNAVEHMMSEQLEGVEFIAANTDHQALEHLQVPVKVQLGAARTRGLGAGSHPEVGRDAALEDRDRILQALEGADMVFITAGMGGGTGTGAAPVVAQLAKGLDMLTVAVVTKPFDWENRKDIAERGIVELTEQVDSLIAIPNDRLLDVIGDDATLDEAFSASNDVLRGAVQGIADIVIRPGRINVDFADVRTVMSQGGMAIMGTGQASGEDRAQRATEMAVHSPLLDDIDLRGARGVIVNVTTAPSLGIREFRLIGDKVRDLTAKDSTVVLGTVNDPDMGDEMRVTVVATGLGGSNRPDIDRPEVFAPPSSVRPSVGQVSPAPQGRQQYDERDAPKPAAAGPARAGRAAFEEFDQPTVLRKRVAGSDVDYDPLHIPTFLRDQAD